MMQKAREDAKAAKAHGKLAMASQKQALEQLKRQEQRTQLKEKRKQQQLDASRMSETGLKEKIVRKKEELKQQAVDLEGLVRQEKKEKNTLQHKEEETADIQRKIVDVKSKADASGHKMRSYQLALQKIKNNTLKLKADTTTKLTHIKTKIAEAEAKKPVLKKRSSSCARILR